MLSLYRGEHKHKELASIVPTSSQLQNHHRLPPPVSIFSDLDGYKTVVWNTSSAAAAMGWSGAAWDIVEQQVSLEFTAGKFLGSDENSREHLRDSRN